LIIDPNYWELGESVPSKRKGGKEGEGKFFGHGEGRRQKPIRLKDGEKNHKSALKREKKHIPCPGRSER